MKRIRKISTLSLLSALAAVLFVLTSNSYAGCYVQADDHAWKGNTSAPCGGTIYVCIKKVAVSANAGENGRCDTSTSVTTRSCDGFESEDAPNPYNAIPAPCQPTEETQPPANFNITDIELAGDICTG